MITISAFHDREAALISKTLLEAAGVPVALKDVDGKLQLQVRDSDARIAQEILVGTESPDWRRSVKRGGDPRISDRAGVRVGLCFLKGGGWAVGGVLLFLLLLLPFGIRFPLTPFPLFFIFAAGGCVAVCRKFFRIRRQYWPRSRR